MLVIKNKIKASGLIRGLFSSVLTSIKISIVLFLLLLLFISNKGSGNIADMIFGLLGFSFYTALITLVISFCIGIPVVVILVLAGFENEWISASIGAFIVLMNFLFSGGLGFYVLIFIFYGFCCAYSFMKGYKKS